MNEEARQKNEADQEAVRREMYRKSKDVIRIYNPLDVDFKFKYNSYPYLIKSHQAMDVERYIARHYFKKIADYIIGQLKVLKGQELLKAHDARGQGGYLDKYIENKEVWDKTPNLHDPDLLKKVAQQTILGLVHEYGLDVDTEMERDEWQPEDTRSSHEQILDLFENKLAEDKQAPEPLPDLVTNLKPVEM